MKFPLAGLAGWFFAGAAVLAAPVLQLDQAVPTPEGRYAVPSSVTRQGTVVVAFVPEKNWQDKTDAPDVILQIGGRHWEPDSFTILREPDHRLVFYFRGGGDAQAAFAVPASEVVAGQVNTAGYAFDEGSLEVFFNGRKIASHPELRLTGVAPDALSVGRPYHSMEKDWHFNGRVVNLLIDDARLSDTEIASLMSQWSRRAARPLDEPGNYVRTVGDLVRVGTPALELQVGGDGQPVALYDKKAGRFLIEDWNRGGGAWWHFDNPDNRSVPVSNLNTAVTVRTDDGRAEFIYRHDNGSEMTVRVRPGDEGELRFNYTLANRFGGEVDFVYFPHLAGMDKAAGGWAFQSHWNGQKRDIRDLEYMCWGGPGHLSMLVSAAKVGPSTLLFYPQDADGAIKFAIADDMRSGPEGVLNLNWQNRDYIQPGETFAEPYDYTLFALGDAGLPQVAEQYRRWAERQSWFETYAGKLERIPNAARIHDGVIKMGGLEAVGEDGGVPAPLAWKEEHCKILTFDYKRFLEVAESIERLYGIKPAFRYDGWWGRFDSRYPDYFPVDTEMGDFEAFIAANRAAGRLVYLHTNPIQWDEDAPSFDPAKMSQPEPGSYSESVWSRNKLFFGSPRLILDDEVRAVRRMVAYGVEGIFEDVIGCTTMVDMNPDAGYDAKVRATGTRALLELCRALYQASPAAFRGTEGGEERRIPYYTAFMLGSGDASREFVPFFAMVYGDCIANATGIDGGTTDPAERNRRLLFGEILGLDGRAEWGLEYDAEAHMHLAAQQVLKQALGKRMVDFDDGGEVWYSSWGDVAVAANLGEGPVGEYRHGDLVLRGVGPHGAALAAADGSFAVWDCAGVEYRGRELFAARSGAGFAAIRANGRLLLGNTSGTTLTLDGLELDGERWHYAARTWPDNAGFNYPEGVITLPANRTVWWELP